MADFNVTLIFQGRVKGWTEGYILRGANDNHSAQRPIVEAFCKARAACLATPCYIKGFRISRTDIGPDALLSYKKFFPRSLELPSTGTVIKFDDAAEPDVALLIRCSTNTENRHKFIYLRGFPDNIESNHGDYTPTPAWRFALDIFGAALTNTNWGWLGVDTVNAKIKCPVTNVVQNVSGTATFTFSKDIFPAAMPVGTLTKIRVSGVNKKSPANGVHIVRKVSNTEAVTENALAAGIYHFGGKGSWAPLTFVTIENFEAQKIVERKAGAPLLSSRGRQPAKARG